MFEKYKTEKCKRFYYEYDRIIKVYPVHKHFFDYLRKEFVNLSDVSKAHKGVVRIFIKYFKSRIIEGDSVATIYIKQKGPSYKKIFEDCYKFFFNVAFVPENPSEVEDVLFRNEKDCFKFFECVEDLEKKGVSSENVDDDVLDEFRFVGEFSRFVYSNRNIEPLSFFGRFLFVYPFDKKISDSEDNREWREKHNEYFEKIKQDKNSETELENARQWYAEQLKKLDFGSLIENEKSLFLTEAFVAFANISSAKSGGIEGFVPELRNLLYIGRYYNIHLLPLKLIEWEKGSEEEKMAANIAHETWRSCCGYEIIYDENDINEAIKDKKSKMVIDPQFGKKARRCDVARLLTQQSSGEQISKNDNASSVIKKYVTNVPLASIVQNKSESEAFDILREQCIEKSNFRVALEEKMATLSINERAEAERYVKEYFSSNAVSDWKQQFSISPNLSIYKSGYGLLTHYDCYNTKPISLEKMYEKFVESLFKG